MDSNQQTPHLASKRKLYTIGWYFFSSGQTMDLAVLSFTKLLIASNAMTPRLLPESVVIGCQSAFRNNVKRRVGDTNTPSPLQMNRPHMLGKTYTIHTRETIIKS